MEDEFDDESIYGDPQRLFAALGLGKSNMPMPAFPTLAEIQKESKKRVSQIFSDFDALAWILERYENVVRSRWIKKTNQQRRALLLQVYPNMPSVHRPDFEAMRKETPSKRNGKKTCFHDNYLLPAINLEDLSKPKNLLLFLQARGRNTPDIFRNLDFNSTHLGRTTGAIVPPYLDGYVMLLVGQKSATSYGRLVSWNEDSNAFSMMIKGLAIQPGSGLLVLEIQERVLGFLLKCTQHILHGIPLGDTSIPKQLTPSIVPLPHQDSEWPSLTKEVLESAYRVPDQFDVARLQSFVYAKRAEAEDHIWSLREDPSYFADHAYEWSEHRRELLIDTNGKTHPILGSDKFWDLNLRNMVIEAYGILIIWDQFEKEIKEVDALRSSYGDRVSPAAELPKDYKDALSYLSYFIDQITQKATILWSFGMPASPSLRKHFVRESSTDNNTNEIRVRMKSDYKEDYFLWLLERMSLDDQRMFCGLENLTDEIERMLRSNQECLKRLSPWLADILSDLCLLAEFKRQFALLSPGPSMLVPDMDLNMEDLEAEFSRRIPCLNKISIMDDGMKLASVGIPLNKFNYPANKRRTANVTKQMQEAEGNLDLFWKYVDDHVLGMSGESLHQLLGNILKEHDIQRTRDWTERDTPLSRPKDTNVQDLVDHTSTLDLEHRTEKTIATGLTRELKAKPKTRGCADPSKSTAVPEQRSIQTTVDQPPTFSVSKRGYKVFSTLFFNPSDEEPPGEIPWSEFLSAMASVGFSIKSLDGSAWIFAPVSDLFHRSIIFHEPHPSNKIPYRTARRFGRRLERAFGWTAASFVRG